MSANWIFTVVALIALALVLFLAGMVIRRWWVTKSEAGRALNMRVIRSELLQAVARGDDNFIIEHWSSADRQAAMAVASQLVCLIKGRDRERLLDILDANQVLRKPLAKLNRFGTQRRLAAVKSLAPFGSKAVLGTFKNLMLDDPSIMIRVEAALTLAKFDALATPWQTFLATNPSGSRLAPGHFELFRAMMPRHSEAFLAMALHQDVLNARLLAIDALGFGGGSRDIVRLGELMFDEDPAIRLACIAAAQMRADPAACPWLEKALADDLLNVRECAERAAFAIGFAPKSQLVAAIEREEYSLAPFGPPKLVVNNETDGARAKLRSVR